MKHYLFVLTIFLSTFCYSQKGNLALHIVDNYTKKQISFSTIYIKKFNLSRMTDVEGAIRMDSLQSGKYEIQISHVGYHLKIVSLIILEDSTTTREIDIHFPCEYDSSKFNSACPICHKSNRVVPIVYGLPMSRKLDSKHYFAGCEITFCDPNWYCKRDKLKF